MEPNDEKLKAVAARLADEYKPGDFIVLTAGYMLPWTVIYKGVDECGCGIRVYAAAWTSGLATQNDDTYVDTDSNAHIMLFEDTEARLATDDEREATLAKLKANHLVWDADKLRVCDDPEWAEKHTFSSVTFRNLTPYDAEFLMRWAEARRDIDAVFSK